jgi:hypothetical protein
MVMSKFVILVRLNFFVIHFVIGLSQVRQNGQVCFCSL